MHPEASSITHTNPHALPAPAQHWHRIVLARDWDALPALLDAQVTYHTPAQLEPLRGRQAVTDVLRLVFSAFDSFAYLRSFAGEDGHALEFTARVGDSTLFGIDLVRFDADGKLVELVVMLRPREGLDALGAALARRAQHGDAQTE
ncbi:MULTISPECIES: nuclear transport factor 2 family protein [Xanthomonas]|jgi:hypothetical protein|uniref:Nuclear transport factor 2 family protein n=1 Tax=Xanthomonas dyei TaxID=743699 RepID=A0ABZ0D8W7_9XANT|nr:nuclear transport factor 2 family protein [Xanthomonas dyei]MCC4634443.1 nuclear transport factor 2 family protein [Xanthomonas dyei pv. eucalypti]WOB26561.1 nuclear transport factor 2 family protein [Xanthomonas dyei]WOB54180.1 nuclear transport factor 2 family protein [Xanthomonas dyei]